jgi:hypothetical protein
MLAVIGINSCKKNAAEDVLLQVNAAGDSLRSFAVPKGALIISPAKSDTGIDVNSGVVITRNSLMNVTSIRLSKLVLKKGTENVAGKIESSDTLITFIPDNALEKRTSYSLEVSATVQIVPEKELQPFSQLIEDKYSFITAAEEPEYAMTRVSTHVTDFPRDGANMIQFGNYLYLYGGWNAFNSWNDIYRSTGDLSTWERMPDAPWYGRHTFGLGKLSSGLFVFGGDYIHDMFDVWRSTDGINFQSVASNLEATVQRRLIYGTCVHNNKLYVMGGQLFLEDTASGLHDVWESANGLAWKKIADGKTFLGKNLAGCVTSFNGRIWVVGGGYYRHPDSTVRWTNHIYSSADGVDWRQEVDGPWSGRQYANVCVWDNRLWMIGGHNGKNLDEVWYMNKNGSWVKYTPPNLFTARHAAAIAVYNNKLVLACGDYNNECWVIEKN